MQYSSCNGIIWMQHKMASLVLMSKKNPSSFFFLALAIFVYLVPRITVFTLRTLGVTFGTIFWARIVIFEILCTNVPFVFGCIHCETFLALGAIPWRPVFTLVWYLILSIVTTALLIISSLIKETRIALVVRASFACLAY